MAAGAQERARALRPGDAEVGWCSSAFRTEQVALAAESAAARWGRAPHAISAAS
ncbi:hypothetical protein ACFUV2_28370 [Streptomyces pilosus]|uniref:hypothetical protein n=1 Tax=Streptomyces pilosus TaxID=28893 RepID=UPI003641E4C9